MDMWEAMKITALGDLGWALVVLFIWILYKMFLEPRK